MSKAQKHPKKRLLPLITATALIASAGFVYYSTGYVHAEDVATQAEPPAMPVDISIAKQAPVQIWKEFSGRIEAVDFAEIRPQINGRIDEIKFKDGQEVTKGDILFVIDPRPFEAEVKRARAELLAAKNKADLAEKELIRAKNLIKSKTVSESIFDERENTFRVTKSEVEAAEANLATALVNVDHAYVKAPITGRVSRAEITVGNIVESGPSAPVLTSIVSRDGIYADFDVDEQTYLHYVRSSAKNRDQENNIPVRLTVGSGAYEYSGHIHSFDNRINTATGTIRARAYLPNTDNALLPGMFAKISMGSASEVNKITVSELAIGTNQDRKFVYVVGEGNVVEYQEVKVGESISGKRIIESGLKDGDKVISGGTMRIRPGMKVAPKTNETSN